MTDLNLPLHLNDPRHAINFVLDDLCSTAEDAVAFLQAWRDGDLREWPDYIRYVEDQITPIDELTTLEGDAKQ